MARPLKGIFNTSGNITKPAEFNDDDYKWVSGARYAQNALIYYESDTQYYRNITGTNTTATPDTDGTNWALFSSGEVNTGSNLGTSTDGAEIFDSKDGVDLQFKRIKAGTNVSITEETNDIVINSAGGGGTGTTYTFLDEGEVLNNQSNVDRINFSGSGISAIVPNNGNTINVEVATLAQNIPAAPTSSTAESKNYHLTVPQNSGDPSWTEDLPGTEKARFSAPHNTSGVTGGGVSTSGANWIDFRAISFTTPITNSDSLAFLVAADNSQVTLLQSGNYTFIMPDYFISYGYNVSNTRVDVTITWDFYFATQNGSTVTQHDKIGTVTGTLTASGSLTLQLNLGLEDVTQQLSAGDIPGIRVIATSDVDFTATGANSLLETNTTNNPNFVIVRFAEGGHTIQNSSATDFTQRENLQFTGSGVSVIDDSINDTTIITIPGSVGSGSDVRHLYGFNDSGSNTTLFPTSFKGSTTVLSTFIPTLIDTNFTENIGNTFSRNTDGELVFDVAGTYLAYIQGSIRYVTGTGQFNFTVTTEASLFLAVQDAAGIVTLKTRIDTQTISSTSKFRQFSLSSPIPLPITVSAGERVGVVVQFNESSTPSNQNASPGSPVTQLNVNKAVIVYGVL